jgi:hypothetical protein
MSRLDDFFGPIEDAYDSLKDTIWGAHSNSFGTFSGAMAGQGGGVAANQASRHRQVQHAAIPVDEVAGWRPDLQVKRMVKLKYQGESVQGGEDGAVEAIYVISGAATKEAALEQLYEPPAAADGHPSDLWHALP